ncbi:MAG: efflux RND transporter permease subunit, partial [Vulcanimicrobiaceae bacterium]
MARIEDQPAALRVRSGKAVTRLSISHLAIAYPWATAIFWIALSAAGIVGFLGLKLALLPNITLPVVTVTAHSNQIDPSVNERTVTEPLEAALGGLRGLNSLHSLTYPEYVVVDMSFAVGADLAAREASVRSAVRDVRLPPGTSLSIATINLNEFPVVTFAATDSHRNLDSLARYVEARIVPNLKAIPGVLKVQVIGAVRSGANASIYRAAGVPALGVSVIKKADANSVDIGEAAAERV